MAQNVYENMVILDPNKYAQDPSGLAGQIPNLVAKCGGEVLVSRLWNEQKLAYPIDGHKKGNLLAHVLPPRQPQAGRVQPRAANQRVDPAAA